MSDWPKRALGTVATIERRGRAPEQIADGTKYLGLENIDRGGNINGYQTIGEVSVASTKFVFSGRHVLFGKLRPNLGKIARPEIDGVCSTDILPVLPGPGLDRAYLTHFLRQPNMVEFAASRAAGANLPRLSPTELAKFLIPMPPIEEQRRIAAILDQADALRSKRSEAIALLDDLTQSIFIDMFGEERALAPLGDYLRFVTSGGRGWAKYYAEEGELFIRSLDVRMNRISVEEAAYVVAPDNAEARRTRTEAGDVLLTVTGSRIGRAAPLSLELASSYVSQHVAILRPKAEVLRPEFLSFVLCMPNLGQRLIARSQYGQSKPGLNFEQIRGFLLPLPPVNRQDEFLERQRFIEGLRSRAVEGIDQLDELFGSAQAQAFSGQL